MRIPVSFIRAALQGEQCGLAHSVSSALEHEARGGPTVSSLCTASLGGTEPESGTTDVDTVDGHPKPAPQDCWSLRLPADSSLGRLTKGA